MDPNLNDKVKTILTTEVKFVIAVVGFVFGIITPYYQMRQDVALIKSDISNINQNHEVHIQDLTQEIKDLNTLQVAQSAQIIELQKQNITIMDRLTK